MQAFEKQRAAVLGQDLPIVAQSSYGQFRQISGVGPFSLIWTLPFDVVLSIFLARYRMLLNSILGMGNAQRIGINQILTFIAVEWIKH